MTAKRPRCVKMTAKKHAELVAGGCDPHCHACKQPIAIGERWALKVFIRDHPIGGTMAGLFGGAVNIRGSCCEACVKADRGLPLGEIVDFDRRLNGWVDKVRMPGEAPKPKERTQPGCFVLPDGTIL